MNETINHWLNKTFNTFLKDIENNFNNRDFIGITSKIEKFAQGEVWLSFRRIADLKTNDILNLIESAIQSNMNFDLNETFNILYVIVEDVAGKGRV